MKKFRQISYPHIVLLAFLRRIILLCLLISFVISGIHAAVISVGPGEKIKDLRSGILVARDGDMLLIRKGHYTVINLTIKKKIRLKGEGMPVLDAAHQGDVLDVFSDGVVVEGVEIRNTKVGSMKEFAGIRFSNCKNAVVRDCKFEGTFFAIYLSNVTGASIQRNHITGKNTEMESGNGIHCWKSGSVKIDHNEVKGHRDGIYIEFTKHSLIASNTCTNNFRYGLHFMFSDYDSYIGNHFRNNGAGVAVMYTHHVEMMYNVFEYNRGSSAYGLLLKDISESVIRNNRFEQNSTGIYLEGTSKVRIEQNDILNNGWGIRIMADCMQDSLIRNNILGNTFDVATNGSKDRNFFHGNYWDKYEGYDLDRNGKGDVPYHPVSLFSQVNEKMPFAIMLYRSFLVTLLDRAERAIPTLNGIEIQDRNPSMTLIRKS